MRTWRPHFLALALLAAVGAPGAGVWAAERVAVRVGEHPGFSRIVFDWSGPVGARLEQRAGKAILRFDRAGELDLRQFRSDPPPEVADIDAASDGDGLVVTLTIVPGARTRLFESDGHAVLDVLRAGTPANAGASTPDAWRRRQAAQAAKKKPGQATAQSKPASAAGPAAPAERPPPVNAPISLLPAAPPETKRTDQPAAEPTPQGPRGAAGPKAAPTAAPKPGPASKPQAAPDLKAVSKPEAAPNSEANRHGAAAGRPGGPPPGPASEAGGTLVLGGSSPFTIDISPLAGRAMPREVPRVLRFDWPTGGTAAAAFRRDGKTWLVFDRASSGDLAAAIGRAAPELEPVEQIETPGATVIRFAAPPLLVERLHRENTTWVVELESGVQGVEAGIEALVEGSAEQARILFRVAKPGRVITLIDPDLGGRLVVVPVSTAGLGRGVTREFPQFRVLASRQGLIIQPLSESLRVAVTPDAVEVRDSEGLIVSRGSSLALLKSNVAVPRRGSRLFDLEAWRRGDAERFRMNKHALQRALAQAGPERTGAARLELAQFYFAHGLASEALGVLRLGKLKDPRLASDPRARLIEGAGKFLSDDFTGAAEHIFHPSLAGEWEADLWRAALAAAGRDWTLAAAGFAKTDELIAAYPHTQRVRLRLLAAEAGLAVGDLEGAERTLEAVRRDDPTQSEQAQTAFLVARRLHLTGDAETAALLWQRVAASNHPPSRTRARLALLDLALEQGSTTADQAIEELERLRFAWRGDRFEFAILQRLGDLYILRGDYRKGLRLLRRATSHTPNSETSHAVAERMRTVFTNLFRSQAQARIPPLQALALFEEFKELTPSGPEGDEVILRLADRLIDVDLLDRAAGVLESQIAYRLHGPAKARAAARLALVRLLNQEPAKALEALDTGVPPDLPAELIAERRRLRARALLELDRSDEALAALGTDDRIESLRLRARILQHQENWPAAVLVLERLVPLAPPAERPLREAEMEAVISLAAALTMAGEREKIRALERNYAQAMSRGPYRDAFAVLIGDGEPDRVKSIAEKLAEADRVAAFLAGAWKRNGQAGQAGTR